MTTKIKDEPTEAQPETRAELEKTLAKLAAMDQAENEKKQAAEMQRIAAIHARKARLDQLRQSWNSMEAAAMPWNIIHELAGKQRKPSARRTDKQHTSTHRKPYNERSKKRRSTDRLFLSIVDALAHGMKRLTAV